MSESRDTRHQQHSYPALVASDDRNGARDEVRRSVVCGPGHSAGLAIGGQAGPATFAHGRRSYPVGLLPPAQHNHGDAQAAVAALRQLADWIQAAAGVSWNLFRREGEYWTVLYEGSVARLKDAKGLRYMARLLADPGRELHASDLAAAGTQPARPAPSGARDLAGAGEVRVRPDLGDAGELLDSRAKAAYQARLGELAAELEEADRLDDPGRAATTAAERDFLVAELARAVGLGGRGRRAASHAERARLDVTRAIRAAMAHLARANPPLGRQLELALADRLRGRLDDAERGFTASLAGWRAAGERGSAIPVCDLLGRVHLARGRLDAALGTFQLALEIATEPGRPALPAAGVAYAGMAEVEYRRDELEAALRHVTEGIARLRPVNHTAPMAAALARLSWIRQATGDAAGALEAIGEAERVAPSPAVTGLVNPVPAQRARLLLAQGNVAAAARWTQEHGLTPEDEPSYPHEQEYLVLARVLLAQDHPGEALALLDRLLGQAAAQDRMGSVIEIQGLRALALAADGDEPAAVNTLAEALILASPERYMRAFADEGPPMRALLGRVIAARRAGQAPARGIPFRQLARVTEAFDGTPDVPGSRPDAPAGVPGLIDPLTGRELQVLAMLAEGTPNQAIAKELFVTVFTVKKHVSHILGKLGAANRTEAVARARDLGLIP